jgi:hypothetical protein
MQHIYCVYIYIYVCVCVCVCRIYGIKRSACAPYIYKSSYIYLCITNSMDLRTTLERPPIV